MTSATLNKHQKNSGKTRDKLIEAAEELYGSGSIDAVSLNEITAAAGQRNRNALQYHFKSRDGLLQAIVDKHSSQVGVHREEYVKRAGDGEWTAPEGAARCLVMPVVDYIDTNPKAVNYVLIISQLTALNVVTDDLTGAMGVNFPQEPGLRELLDDAMSALPSAEAQRRIHLAVNIAFHSLADIYRTQIKKRKSLKTKARDQMIEQLVCVLESFFAATARE
ncbi:TetR/AcrR family transcriptional regulator [Pseudomaricurvus alkylphenolicus]|uniref:TetR/AcrR family transcriptional regulator n=1 Tax=Pseudomaricurvus alkylphenolicus TaxID=1306991 RepID=UPI001423CC46|nr:helix-turn-helix domain-containing protein [Pseudomaricurvus alkylphenolicus]NIB37991.1 TetR/AcrR family transcriptional regulator [Pseudomaricurvus alkylphenolicus]